MIDGADAPAASYVTETVALKLAGRRHEALFVGQWAPTFLLLGIYNKLVKLHGSDQTDK